MLLSLILGTGLLLIGAALAVTLTLLFRQQNQWHQLKSNLNQELSQNLQKPFLDLSDRISKNFQDTQERIERTLGMNRQELQTGLLNSTQALETKFRSLEQQVGLRLETIGKNVETKLNENIKEGFRHFEKVQQHLQSAELKLQSLNLVGQSISDLNQLLKLPHLRGGFGEATLERLLADFMPTGMYELQYQVVPGSPERVDAIVRFSKQILPIDSKFPREAVLPLFDSQDPAVLETARKALADFVKEQAKTIADKYIRPDHGTTEMALLFLPSETLYFEVIRNGKLFEHLAKLKVFPVSPNTLSISLNSVAMAQDYYDMARGVEKTIEEVKKARRHFEHFEKKFDELGKGLKKAQEAFDTANTHLGRYESSVFRLIGEEGEGETPALKQPVGEQQGLL